MDLILTHFAKNDKGTGLQDIISRVYNERKQDYTLIFNTKNGIEKIKMGWKDEHRVGKKIMKGYYYIIPAKISDSKKPTEFFASTQGLFIPSITTTLNLLEFKAQDLKGVSYEKKTKTEDLFTPVSQELELDEIDFDNLEKSTKSSVKNYRLWAIEILHKMFKEKTSKIYWPNDVKYQAVEDPKKISYHWDIKQVHLFKKLMGETLVDYPLQQLVDLSITQENFNVTAKGIQPLVIELQNGGKYEGKQYRAKILIQEGVVRIPYLYAELSEELHTELVGAGVITDTKYQRGKTFKVIFEGTSGKELPLVNPNIRNIPVDEIIDLVWDIETLLVRQTVYNKGLKELEEKTKVFNDFILTDEDRYLYSLGLGKDGTFNPKVEEGTIDTHQMRNTTIGTKIGIAIEGFPKTAITKEETDTLMSLIKLDKPLDSLLKQVEWMKKEIENIKDSLTEKRYKLSLIKTAFFVRGFPKDLPYDADEDGNVSFEKEVKAADSYDGKKEMRFFKHSKKSDLRLKVEMQKVIKEV